MSPSSGTHAGQRWAQVRGMMTMRVSSSSIEIHRQNRTEIPIQSPAKRASRWDAGSAARTRRAPVVEAAGAETS